MPTTIPPELIHDAWFPSRSSRTTAAARYSPSSVPCGHEGFWSRVIPKPALGDRAQGRYGTQ